MYGKFSSLYDDLMKDVNYIKTAEYYQAIFDKFGQTPELMLDLGCGSGNLTKIMQEKGYDMIGIDASEEMLSVAKEKDSKSLYLQMDATDFELYGTVDAIVSYLDLVNYLTEDSDLDSLMRLVNNYLNYDGLFVFDISTEYKLKNILGNNTFTYDDGKIFYVWENCLEDSFCNMLLTFFVKEGECYNRIEEEQCQRIYTPEEIILSAQKAGLVLLGIFGEDFNPPKENDERIYFVMQRRKS